MGFFSLKVKCAVCDKDVGLNRYQLSKDVWICPTCLKKVGGIYQFNIIKSTSIEDLKEKVKQYDDKEKENMNKLSDFNVTKKVERFISIDENKKQWFTSSGITNINQIKIYNFSDVQSFELLEDGETVSKGGLGRAVAGGILFGGVGAVVGGVTGAKKTNSICSKLQIKITVKDINNPIVYINLISSDTKKDSFVYKTLYNSAQEIMSILQLMTDENKDTQPQEVASTVSTADELKKYKDLLDSGAITEEEYNKVKSKLLGI